MLSELQSTNSIYLVYKMKNNVKFELASVHVNNDHENTLYLYIV
jgi:hypothetical protein